MPYFVWPFLLAVSILPLGLATVGDRKVNKALRQLVLLLFAIGLSAMVFEAITNPLAR